MYDVVIVGAGVSGLLSAYHISKLKPELKCVVLEKNDHLGGRIQYDCFYNEPVKMGGGILRKKDKETARLLKTLHIPYKTGHHQIQYVEEPLDIVKMIKKAQQSFNNNPPRDLITFREYALELWGEELYQHFLDVNMYNDFENFSAKKVLFHYDFSYNTNGYWEGEVEWYKLINALEKHIPYPIQTECTVKSIIKQKYYKVNTSLGSILTKKIVLAVEATTLNYLLPKHGYQWLVPNSSIKVYAKVADEYKEFFRKNVPIHTIVPGLLHNIIPISRKKGIYLIGYCDEDKARDLYRIVKTKNNKQRLARLTEEALELPKGSIKYEKIHAKYWPCAMHTTIHHPMPENLQYPHRNIRVVGEAVGEHGWVGGAVDTVKPVITLEWLNE